MTEKLDSSERTFELLDPCTTFSSFRELVLAVHYCVRKERLEIRYFNDIENLKIGFIAEKIDIKKDRRYRWTFLMDMNDFRKEPDWHSIMGHRKISEIARSLQSGKHPDEIMIGIVIL